jgi:hypothetical protein
MSVRTKTNHQWINVEVGFVFAVDKGKGRSEIAIKSKKKIVKYWVYARFNGAKLKGDDNEKWSSKMYAFPSEKSVLPAFAKCLNGALENARTQATPTTLPTLRTFEVPPLP